jgi:hypothetical protein
MRFKTSLFVAALFVFGVTSYAKYSHHEAAPAVAESTPVAAAIGDPDKARFAQAVRLYRAGQWSAAYGRFIELADRDHKYAAVISLQMLRNGPHFYRSEWSATPSQVAHWQRVAGHPAAIEAVASGE